MQSQIANHEAAVWRSPLARLFWLTSRRFLRHSTSLVAAGSPTPTAFPLTGLMGTAVKLDLGLGLGVKLRGREQYPCAVHGYDTWPQVMGCAYHLEGQSYKTGSPRGAPSLNQLLVQSRALLSILSSCSARYLCPIVYRHSFGCLQFFYIYQTGLEWRGEATI